MRAIHNVPGVKGIVYVVAFFHRKTFVFPIIQIDGRIEFYAVMPKTARFARASAGNPLFVFAVPPELSFGIQNRTAVSLYTFSVRVIPRFSRSYRMIHIYSQLTKNFFSVALKTYNPFSKQNPTDEFLIGFSEYTRHFPGSFVSTTSPSGVRSTKINPDGIYFPSNPIQARFSSTGTATNNSASINPRLVCISSSLPNTPKKPLSSEYTANFSVLLSAAGGISEIVKKSSIFPRRR